MKKFLIILLVLIAGLGLGGLALDSDIQVRRELAIDATPQQIHPFVDDLAAWDAWSPWDAKDPTIVYTYDDGPRSGVGASRSWTSEDSGTGTMTIVESDPSRGVWIDMVFEGDMSAQIAFTFEPRPDGTTVVVWEDDFTLGANPVWRWMGLFMDSMLGADFEDGLARLKSEVEAATGS